MADTTTSGTGHDGGGAHEKFPPLNVDTFAPQIIWLAIVFWLLYSVLKRLVLPRVGEMIEERAERVRRDIETAEKLNAQTAKTLAAYEQALGEARASANRLVKEMREKLGTGINVERGQVEGRLAEITDAAELRIARAKAKALSNVNEISAGAASAIVLRLLGAEVSRGEIERALLPRAAE